MLNAFHRDFHARINKLASVWGTRLLIMFGALAIPHQCFASTIFYSVDPTLDILVGIDSETGDTTRIGELGSNYGSGGLTFVGDDLYYISSRELAQINPLTGAATTLFTFGDEVLFISVAFSNGVFYAGDTLSNTVFTIDLATGFANSLGTPISLRQISALADLDEILFGIDNLLGTLFTIDTGTGASSSVDTDVPVFSGINALTSFGGLLYGIAGGTDERLVTIDPLTGEYSELFSLGAPNEFNLFSIATRDTLQVSTPSALSLILLPLVLLLRRRKS